MKKEWYIIGIGVFVVLIIFVAVISSRQGSSRRVISRPLITEVDKNLKEGKILQARQLYQQIMEETDDLQTLEFLKKKIEDLNMKILMAPDIIDECSIVYEVKPKDTLIKIARQFGTTVALIKKINGLKSDIIKPGEKLKVSKCTFSIVIDKSQNRLFLKRNGEIFKTYVVSTGKNNSTPAGKFKIINKLKNPTWFKAGAVVPPGSPDNILGTRWMGLSVKGYGIHGNRDENEIGKQVTQGCIRMKNKDVEELFDIVPVGTEVVIID